MVLVQKRPFLQLFFLGNMGQESVSYEILERKNTFLVIKRRSSKSRKIDIFPKGLTHDFCQKMAIFPTVFFRQYRPGKCVLIYSRKKKAFLDNEKKRLKKSKSRNFS